MDYISNYLNNWLQKLTTTTARPSELTTGSGGVAGGLAGGWRPPLVPGGHSVWINSDDADSEGGSGMSGQRRGGLLDRDGYLDYIRRRDREEGQRYYWE